MDNNKNKSRQKSSKAPPQIANFFSKPLSPQNQRLPSSSPPSPNERKRKLSEQEAASQIENPTSYSRTLGRVAAKISKIPKAKKTSTVVSTFFQLANSDDLSDFESPSKKIQFKTPPVIPKKKVTRKRKLVTKQTKMKEALEAEAFEKVLRQYSSENGMNSDDLQMALALSRSLTDTHGSNESESANISSIIRNAEPSKKEDIVRQTFQKFGFKKKDNTDYDYRDFFGNLGSKRKWASKFTPLTRRSEHIQKEKFKNNVKNILQASEGFETVDSEAIHEYSVTSSYLQQFSIPKSPTYNISLAVTEAKIQEFYVNHLVPISTLGCGCLLKSWADIPGRDVSPQRAISPSCHVNDATITPETPIEDKRNENIDTSNYNVGNVVEPNMEPNDSCDIFESSMDIDSHRENSNSSQHLHADQRSHEDISTKIDLPNQRSPSPDLFDDYESSVNSSLNDDVLENQNTDDYSIKSKDSPCGTSENNLDMEQINNENSHSQKTQNVLPVQHQENDAVVLSSDDSNLGSVNFPESASTTSQQKSVGRSSVTLKQLSFTNRLQIYNCDPALGTSDDEHISSFIDQSSSQDSIVISDDEINYSNNNCNGGKLHDTVVGHHNTLSQESIVLSDSEDEEKAVGSQPMDDEMEERQSFSSIDLDNENGFASLENGQDRSNGEVFNSNQSSKDEDSIARSIRQLCQKENAFGSLNSSTNIYSTELPSVDMASQESIVLSDSDDEKKTGSQPVQMDYEVEEQESFASISLDNENDFGNENGLNRSNGEKRLSSNQPSKDEDVISRSIRQLYQQSTFESVNSSKETNIYSTESPLVNMASHESIVLSDSDDDNKTSAQSIEDNIDERQSFASIDLGNECESINEPVRDIDIDDVIYNSNQSLNDEDLINLSVREMCQKEFVSGSSKSSVKTSFSRTTSDLSFERRVWKPSKTPSKLHNLSDDEFDEFDQLVRGNRFPRTPIPNADSIEISDDELEKSFKIRQDKTHRDDESVSDSATPPTECDEFIVQSMDQIYQVRTGKLVSPKPNYENMDSPTRLEHLKKYGLKTLSKRKAVICLEHIYNRLHPFIEVDEQDDLGNILSQKKELAIHSDNNRMDVKAIPTETSASKARLETHFDILQENEDIFYLPSAPRAKHPWCLEPLHVAWHNLIDSNAALNDDILQYKPVDLMDIRSLLKSIGLRYETKDIISFLDRKCITFKTDNKRNAATKT